MARSSTGKHPATSNHSTRPLRLAVGPNENPPAPIQPDWRPDLNKIDFTAAISVETQRATLQAERQAIIGQGYDTQRSKQRLQLIHQANPDRDFHDELALADQNLVTLAEMVVAIDEQLAALDA